MLKLKTKKSFKKRLKVTKNKKILRSKSARRHLLISKTSKRKMKLRKKTLVSKSDYKIVKNALPYDF